MNNSLWELFDKLDRTAEDNEQMLRRAYAAAYHWQRARAAAPENAARADYMISKALLLSGQRDVSLRSAVRCLAICLEHGRADLDLGYAQEARAGALRAMGRGADAAAVRASATALPVADPADREISSKDFADY